MKKLLAVPLVILALLGFTALNPLRATHDLATSAAPSTSAPLTVTSTSAAYFVPLGYIRLSCSQPTYYKVVSSSAGTASSSDTLNYGTTTISGATIVRSSWINITSNQWLALITRGGVSGVCVVEQVSSDGVTGSFTDLTASGNLVVTGTESVTGAATHGAVINAPGFDGGYVIGTTINTSGNTVLGGTLSAAGTTITGTLNNTGDNITASTKTRGTASLNNASPSVATATVNTGAICVCANNTTTTNDVKCAVSGTTLTITGPNTTTDTVSYICMQ